MESPTIELKDISFEAEDKSIVRNVSLAFEEGITTALVGPSGGGKSTVLKIAAGLIVPTEGIVSYRGKDIGEMSRAETLDFRKNAAFVFQDSALWANQTIRQTLELPLRLHNPKMSNIQRTERIVKVLAEVGYKKGIDIRPSQLSMGEQKLIAFARALILGPNVLFLDEWTESLDDVAAKRLVAIVKTMQQEGTTIVFVSHNFKVVKELAARVCMIKDGELTLSVGAHEIAGNDSLSKMIEQGIAV
jgi:ABC-type multidrug transport system ATPase subunit